MITTERGFCYLKKKSIAAQLVYATQYMQGWTRRLCRMRHLQMVTVIQDDHISPPIWGELRNMFHWYRFYWSWLLDYLLYTSLYCWLASPWDAVLRSYNPLQHAQILLPHVHTVVVIYEQRKSGYSWNTTSTGSCNDSFLIYPSLFPSATKGDHAASQRHLIIKQINRTNAGKSKQTGGRLIIYILHLAALHYFLRQDFYGCVTSLATLIY